jgi:hypothetical protein
MQTRVVLRDNVGNRNLELLVEMDKADREFVNRLGEQITRDTDWDITLLAVDPL